MALKFTGLDMLLCAKFNGTRFPTYQIGLDGPKENNNNNNYIFIIIIIYFSCFISIIFPFSAESVKMSSNYTRFEMARVEVILGEISNSV